MDLSTFDYHLPPERIAQTPLPQRDHSRLLVLERHTGALSHRRFTDVLDYFQPGDIIVANNSRVIPARLYAEKLATGGKVELLLLNRIDEFSWQALVGGKKLVQGVQLNLLDGLKGKPTAVQGHITAVGDGPLRTIRFNQPSHIWLTQLGHTPLPPYIHERLNNPDRYQTIYAHPQGSAAAPTAGLHFTPDLLLSLREKGVLFETVTLHVGLDTFKPVTTNDITTHPIHSEWATLTPSAAQRINQAKLAGGRLIAIGTTSTRTLETAALRSAGITGSLQTITQRDLARETGTFCPWKPLAAFAGSTDLYIYPGYNFRAVDALITNFHVPQSTLLMLVSAFASRQQIMTAYETAVAEKYRFLSLGDAMLIL